MTENKRFTKVEHIFELNDEGIKDNQTRIEYYYALDLIDLLNELSEENEQLKKEIKYLQSELHNATYDVRKMTLKEVKDEIEKLERWE